MGLFNTKFISRRKQLLNTIKELKDENKKLKEGINKTRSAIDNQYKLYKDTSITRYAYIGYKHSLEYFDKYLPNIGKENVGGKDE